MSLIKEGFGSLCVAACLGLTLANIIFQYLTKQNWGVAWDRSYYQCSAILVLYLTAKFVKV